MLTDADWQALAEAEAEATPAAQWVVSVRRRGFFGQRYSACGPLTTYRQAQLDATYLLLLRRLARQLLDKG